MTLLPKPAARPATFAVTIYAPGGDEETLAPYEEQMIIDQLAVAQDELPEFVAGFRARAERWFEIQRRAQALLRGRGELNAYQIELDWTSVALEWPREILCEGAAKLNLEGCEALLDQLATLMAQAPEWSLAELGGRPLNARYGSPEAKLPAITLRVAAYGVATINWPGDDLLAPRCLKHVPLSSSAEQVKKAFAGFEREAEQLKQWVNKHTPSELGDHLYASLTRDWVSGEFSVKLSRSRGPWERQEEAETSWQGKQLDLEALELPRFGKPRPVLAKPDDVLEALRDEYSWRSGPAIGDSDTSFGPAIGDWDEFL